MEGRGGGELSGGNPSRWEGGQGDLRRRDRKRKGVIMMSGKYKFPFSAPPSRLFS